MTVRFVTEEVSTDTPVHVYVEDGSGGTIDLRFAVGTTIDELVATINADGELVLYKVDQSIAEQIGIQLGHNGEFKIH